MSASSDRNLLLGILALQLDFVTREQLVAAMNAWVLEKSTPLDQVLLDQGALRTDTRELLTALVAKHLELHAGDAQQSLAAVSSVGSLHEELKSLADPDIDAKLSIVGSACDPSATLTWSVGASTSTGQRFRILRPHAHGGLGQVSVALDDELSREVALKEIRKEHADDPACRSRFVLEAEITGGLEHPGIVPVYGLGQYADGRPFYAMRFIRGDSLKEAVDRFHARGKADFHGVAFRQLLGRFVDVCNAVAYAHSRGVLHRDLKPGNIMLGKYGETLVVDWGLAKVQGRSSRSREETEASLRPRSAGESSATLVGQAVGTPAYMSPEQAAGRLDELGPASDVYSLGATLYYLLCGQAPVSQGDLAELLRNVETGRIRPLRRLKPDISRPLEAICRKAMSLNANDRYSSPAALGDDVERYLGDERVQAWREPWHMGLRRAVRRRRTLAAVLAALALVIPIVAGVGSWLVARERGKAEVFREIAHVKEETAAQMTEYLQRLFATADPFGLDDPGFRRPQPEETTRRLLDSGAELVREHLRSEPLARAELLDAMGNAYRNLGDWAKAEAMLTEGYELRRELLGADEAKTIDSRHSLARLNHDRGAYIEAERLYREVADWRARRYGPNHLLTAQVKFYQGWMTFHRPLAGPVFDQNQLRSSEKLLREVLEVREKELPETHPDVAFTLAALAAVKGSQAGQEQEAALLAARALEIFRQNEASSEVGVTLLVYMKAEADRKARRFDEALIGYSKVLELSKKHLGERHPLVIVQLGNLVGTYRAKGDLDTAIRIGFETLERGRDLPMRSTSGMVNALREFGDMVRQRDRAKAAELYAEALRYARERPAENAGHIKTLEALLAELRDANGSK